MRTPAGPSVRMVSGMPSRGIAIVEPAAPGTVREEFPATAVVDQKSYSPPISSEAFSSRVMACSTSSMLFFDNFGVCAVAVMLIVIANAKILMFIIRLY